MENKYRVEATMTLGAADEQKAVARFNNIMNILEGGGKLPKFDGNIEVIRIIEGDKQDGEGVA